MELECLKFNEKMASDGAYCHHPDDYCKYRTSCIINYLEKENKMTPGSQKKAEGNDTTRKNV